MSYDDYDIYDAMSDADSERIDEARADAIREITAETIAEAFKVDEDMPHPWTLARMTLDKIETTTTDDARYWLIETLSLQDDVDELLMEWSYAD